MFITTVNSQMEEKRTAEESVLNVGDDSVRIDTGTGDGQDGESGELHGD